jgi:hypothetical protein
MFAQSEKIPYDAAPLDATGQPLDALYAYGTQMEMEEALETSLEQERSNAGRASIQTLADDGEAFLTEQWF